MLKTPGRLTFDVSPLKARADGVQIVRSLPGFLQAAPSRSKIRYFTTVLTSLGVLGTFIGIMVGLDGIDKKLEGDTAQTFGAVKDLLGGMSTAFITSIVGLLSSLVLLIVLSVCDKFKFSWHRKLYAVFMRHYRVESLGDYLSALSGEGQQELLDKQLEVARKSEHASDALLEMGQTLQKSAENFDADKIGVHISTSLDNIFRSEMVPVFKAISDELSALRAIKQDNGEAIINAIKEEIVKPLTTEIHNTTQMVGQAAQAINKLNDDLGNISIKLGESVATIQTFQQETMEQLQHFAGDLRDILAGFQTDTKVILEGVADSIKSAVDESITGMTAQRDAFKESAADAAQTFKDIKIELVQALDHQTDLQKGLLDQTAERFDGVIKNSISAFEKQSDVLRDVGEHAAQLMDSSKDNLQLTLGNIEQSLLQTKQVVEEELQLFRTNYQASLTDFFNEQNNLLEQTLGSQRDGLAKVVEDCNTVFVEEYQRRKELSSELGTNLADMQQAVEVVSDLVQSVRMLDAAYVNTIEQAASSIGRQIAGFEKQHQSTQQVLNQFMQQVPEALNSYFNKANDSHVKFFTGMDDAATKIHQRLLQSAEYLVSAEINKRQFAAEEN
uniref:MotA/TolQ/ExbB proton channel family protein n=1 Tax=Rheinheimera sp. TaxID=1869214 RepID=UPI00404751EA